VIANGDIALAGKGEARCSPVTGADAVMIGRAAQGRPWLFREIEHFPEHRQAPAAAAGQRDSRGVARTPRRCVSFLWPGQPASGIARKHISWYTRGLVGSAAFRHRMNQLPTVDRHSEAGGHVISSRASPSGPRTPALSRTPDPEAPALALPLLRNSPHEADHDDDDDIATCVARRWKTTFKGSTARNRWRSTRW
jgi:hypothetical protein